MSTEVGHGHFLRRIAINTGAGFVPGINSVVMGAAMAAGKLGWEMVGIRDGFGGLLRPERYPEGGLVTLSPELVENLDPAAGGILGQAAHVDPFHVRTVNKDDMVEELDLSDLLLKRLKEEKIDALISIVGGAGAEHLPQTPPQRAQYRLRAALHRERHRGNHGLLWVQQRFHVHHRNARPRPTGGPVGPQDRGGRSPRRTNRLAGTAGGHRRLRRCRAHPRDSRQPSDRGRKIEGKNDSPAALRAGGGGGRGQV